LYIKNLNLISCGADYFL